MSNLNLKRQYRDLEINVLARLRMLVDNSETKSKYINDNALVVDIMGYEELVIIDDRLFFICKRGLYYDHSRVDSLEDLIDIVTMNELVI